MKTVVGFLHSRMLLAGMKERKECGKVEVSYLPFCLANLKNYSSTPPQSDKLCTASSVVNSSREAYPVFISC